MKFFIYLSLMLLPMTQTHAQRDPGTGSNPTVGPGPATPGSLPDTTSIHGGGTPGGQGINTLDIEEPSEKDMEMMQDRDKKNKKRPVTDQDPAYNSI